jgi:DNA repair protein RadC
MAISDWPAPQRPRERLIDHGAASLTDAELLALILRVGVTGKNAIELGHEMLKHFGSLNGLFSATVNEFSAIHGLGPAKFAMLQAVLELAQRALMEKMSKGDALGTSPAVKQFLQLRLGRKAHESFAVVYLDVQNRLLACEELFRGSLTHASVYPREVVKSALAHNAAAVIFAHNHPSGNPTPSAADLLLTQTLKRSLALVEVRVLDHFVLAGEQTYSFAEHGEI